MGNISMWRMRWSISGWEWWIWRYGICWEIIWCFGWYCIFEGVINGWERYCIFWIGYLLYMFISVFFFLNMFCWVGLENNGFVFWWGLVGMGMGMDSKMYFFFYFIYMFFCRYLIVFDGFGVRFLIVKYYLFYCFIFFDLWC